MNVAPHRTLSTSRSSPRKRGSQRGWPLDSRLRCGEAVANKSLQLYICCANDLRPLVDFPPDAVGELAGRAGDWLESESQEALARGMQRDDGPDLAMQTRDNVSGPYARHQDAEDNFRLLFSGYCTP